MKMEQLNKKLLNKEKLTDKEIVDLLYKSKEVKEEVGKQGRWTTAITSIIKVEDKLFAIEWGRANTEYQENEVYGQPYEVEEVKGVVGVKKYVRKDPL